MLSLPNRPAGSRSQILFSDLFSTEQFNKAEVVHIADILLGMIIGTAFVYDIYFGIVPNYVLIAGYAGIVPIMYGISGWMGLLQMTAGAVAFTAVLFIVYILGGIGAGDVKLLSLVCGVLGVGEGVKFIAVVFVVGAVMGFVKIMLKASDAVGKGKKFRWSKTGIKFSLPTLAGYLIMLLSKGGLV